MIAESKLTKRNQTTIPKVVLKALKVSPAGRLVYEIAEDGTVTLRRREGKAHELFGAFAHLGRNPRPAAATVGDMDHAVADAIAADYVKTMKLASSRRAP